MGNIIINTMKVLISLCVAVAAVSAAPRYLVIPIEDVDMSSLMGASIPVYRMPGLARQARSWTRNKTTTSPPLTVRTETAKPVVARPMAPHTAPPPTLVPTMLTTEHTLEDTELLDGTLTTPSCSDLDTKCHHQLHHQCHHLQG